MSVAALFGGPFVSIQQDKSAGLGGDAARSRGRMSGVSPPFLRDEDAEIHVGGALVTARLGGIEADFDAVGARSGKVTLNLGELTAFDTGGAWMVAALKSRLAQAGSEVEITHALPAYAALLKNVEAATPERDEEVTQSRSATAMLDSFGRKVAGAWDGVISFNGFLGETLVCISRLVLRPWRLRWASLVTHMQDAGLNAVPIVALMGFLIGIVLAFQGATQLQRFGAEVFVVELISISVLRELGILLTAIIVAGRSGSAFTASVGSMKVQEEIDAMRTLGLDPIEVLVVPRVLALVLVLPILGFVANLCGLFGGALMSWIDLGVSPGMFLTRLYENTGVWHLAIGMIKAPFFAVVIGVVACWQAFQVRGSSTSVGQRTTASVVQGIFLVIVLDALFSIFFAQLGV